jgi:hypothetical protein
VRRLRVPLGVCAGAGAAMVVPRRSAPASASGQPHVLTVGRPPGRVFSGGPHARDQRVYLGSHCGRASVVCHGLAGSGRMQRRHVRYGVSAPVPGGVGATAWVQWRPRGPRVALAGWTPLHRVTKTLAGRGLWSSWALLLCQHFLWCRAVPIPTGLALVISHALEPLPCATLGAGMQRGMVHGEQAWRR